MPTPAQDLAAWIHHVADLAEGADDDNMTIADLLEHNPAQEDEEPEQDVRQEAPEQYAKDGEDRGLIPLPDVPQQTDHDCGAAIAYSVGSYLGVGPDTLKEWVKALGTNVRTSTYPEAIVDFFESLGCPVEAREDMTLEDLRHYWEQGVPVICLISEWGRADPKAELEYGHYVAVVGMGMGLIMVQDPSIDNVLAGEYADQAKGIMPIREDCFLKVWHAQARKGDELKCFGIAVFPPLEDRVTREPHRSPETYVRIGEAEQFGWVKYVGPRGGEGYRNTETGETRYGDMGGGHRGKKDEPLKPVKGKPAPVGREVFEYTDHASHHDTTCANCRFFEDGKKVCHLYEDMNTVMPDKFNLDVHVEPTGWCNNWTPEKEPE